MTTQTATTPGIVEASLGRNPICSANFVAEEGLGLPQVDLFGETVDANLVSFGNYLLKRYRVMVYSSDGTNVPLYQREVTDADLCNWKEDNLKQPI